MRIAVIDGQGGGIGRHITERIRKELGDEVEILALGTNSLATSAMLKAGANEGATGENAVIQNVGQVDVIVGSLAVILAHSMLGELTPAMATAVASSPARKLLLPLNRSGVEVVGATAEPLPHQVERLVQRLKAIKQEREGTQ
jgi:NAD(P)-dependent dehydrogenase (short-subunit alcohol dehydrogenase family)